MKPAFFAPILCCMLVAPVSAREKCTSMCHFFEAWAIAQTCKNTILNRDGRQTDKEFGGFRSLKREALALVQRRGDACSIDCRGNMDALEGTPCQYLIVAGTAASQEEGLASRGTERPSFDCAKAKAPAARLICADRELTRLDGELGTAFQRSKARFPESDQPGFVAAQLAWIRGRNARCGLDGNKAAAIEVLDQSKLCMANAIRERIIDLSSSSGPERPKAEAVKFPAAAPSASSSTDDTSALVVQMSAAVTAANPPEITGSTNLPDGTILSISLLGDPPACTPRCGNAYSSGTVKHGRFSASPLKDAPPLFSGSYTIDIGMVVASQQPESVQSVIGKSGEHLRGQYVVISGDGKEAVVPVTFPLRTQLSDLQRRFGFMIHYRQRIQIAGDPTSDAAMRQQAVADERKRIVESCTSNIDFVNAMVRSGTVTGRETLGAERKGKIETCIADSEAKLQAALNMPQHGANIQPDDAQKPTSAATPTPPALGPASRGPFGCGQGVRCPLPVWERVEAANGAIYYADTATITPSPVISDGKQILVYLDDGRDPTFGNTEWYTFDCNRPRILRRDFGAQPQFVPPRSVFGEIRRIACRELWAVERPKSEDYCTSFSTDACERIREAVEAYALSQVRPSYCKSGWDFARHPDGLTREQLRICYVIAGWPR